MFSNLRSTDGDVASAAQLGVTDVDAGNIGVFHIDSCGNLVWERCIGSELGLLESVRDVKMQSDGEYAIVGKCTWFEGTVSGDVNCSNNLALPDSKKNIWILHITDIFDYDNVGEIEDNENAVSLEIHPNPANTWAAVDYTLPEGFNNAVITLTDSMGLVVYTQNVHGERGQNVINLQKLPVGVYILTIKCEEHRLTEKVVVTR